MNERRIENIPIDKIIPNIYQPRIKFEESKLNELANSLKEYGVIQPIILRNIGDTYEIIDGERRYRAAKKAGFKEIPSIVLNMTEKEAAELLLTENMQKQVLTPIEEANSYQQIMLLNQISVEELSKKLGKDKNYIENKINLLNLPLEIQEALLNNKISEGHAKLLLKIESKTKKIELYKKIITERLTVKALEEIINSEHPEKEVKLETNEFNLDELSNEKFLTEKKENKMEENNMNNEMNFNQYNNLLKEQQTQMMEMTQPAPIIPTQEENKNQFFPSLEEQPLNMDIPVSEEPMAMPQFEVPTFNSEPQIQNPAFEMPQAPAMTEPMAMPQFEVPAFNPEPQIQNPVFEMPQELNKQQPVMVDVMPAVNMIRNLIPLLENSGYKINIEEMDNTGEYQVTLKIQK